jgi:type IV pilus assembly protein PilM
MYVVAAPKSLTDRFRNIAQKAGLELLALETEALATTRAIVFNRIDANGDIIIVDFGASTTNLILARNGVVLFSQISTTGSDALTKAIAADYGIDYAEAEKYKRAFGLVASKGEGKIARSIEPIIQILLSDIVRTLSYFREKVGGKINDTLFLTGEGANLPGLTAYLEAKINLKAQVVNEFTNITIDKKIEAELTNFSLGGMTVAVGLGLKDNNS